MMKTKPRIQKYRGKPRYALNNWYDALEYADLLPKKILDCRYVDQVLLDLHKQFRYPSKIAKHLGNIITQVCITKNLRRLGIPPNSRGGPNHTHENIDRKRQKVLG